MNLTHQDLRQIDLSSVLLAGADLSHSNLSGLDLTGRNLSSAKLSRANLRGAILKHANLSHADLSAADLTEANLLRADLHGAELTGACLCRAKLIGACIDPDALSKADAFGAALPGAIAATPEMPKFLERVIGMVWDQTGRVIFTVGFTGLVSAWDAQRGERIRSWQTPLERIGTPHIAYSSKIHWLASARGDAWMTFWDVAAGTELEAFSAGIPAIACLAFAPAEPLLAIGGTNGAVEVWDVTTRTKHASFTTGQNQIESLAFSSRGKLLASGSRDGIIHLWDIPRGVLAGVFQGAGKIDSLAFSPDETTLLAASCGHPLRSWELEAKREGTPLRAPSIHSVSYSPDGHYLATGGPHGLSIWKADDGSLVQQLSGKALLCVTEIAFAPAGRNFAANDGCISIWDASSGQRVGRLAESLRGFGVRGAGIDSKRLVIAGFEALSFWEIGRGVEVQRVKDLDSIKHLAISPDLNRFAIAGEQPEVRLLDAQGRPIRSLSASRLSGIECLRFNAGAQLLACGGSGGTLLFDLKKRGEPHLLCDRKNQTVLGLAFDPTGPLLAHGGSDGRIALWDLHTLNRPRSRRMHANRIGAICFSNDGSMLASGGEDRILKLSEVATGQLIREFRGHTNEISMIAFNPIGRIVASGASCDRIILWDLTTGETLKTIPAPNLLAGLVFSPDGTHLIESQSGNPARAWNVESGACVASVLPLPEGWVVFDAHGRYRSSGVVMGHFWHAISLCRFEPGELDGIMPDIKLPAEGPLF